jgi:hypothetical protein
VLEVDGPEPPFAQEPSPSVPPPSSQVQPVLPPPPEGGEPDPEGDWETDQDPGPVPAEEAPDATIVERLQPRMLDPRLWAPVDPQHGEPTELERAELLLRGMIQSWNDSMAVAEALSDRARDWTYVDSDGRRWGLAPGRLYLGDFAIPLPLAFDVPASMREERSDRQWMTEDILRGAVSAEIRETWADRARVIRARMEAERAGAQEPGGGAGGN